MKKLTLFAVLLLASSCQKEVHRMEKPFIVIEKTPVVWEEYLSSYTYQDIKGETVYFKDSSYKYSIGDTIK